MTGHTRGVGPAPAAHRGAAAAPSLSRVLAWGAAAAAVYLGAVLFSWPAPVRLLYDGLVPLPPYHWVHPPAASAHDNQPPDSAEAVLGFGPQGSPAVEVTTDDGQAIATFPVGAVAPRADGSPVRVTVVPMDPAALPAAPQGSRFDGNAYRIEARYVDSDAAALLLRPVTVVLRYPVHARRMLRRDAQWTVLPTTVFTESQQLLASTDHLGDFGTAP